MVKPTKKIEKVKILADEKVTIKKKETKVVAKKVEAKVVSK